MAPHLWHPLRGSTSRRSRGSFGKAPGVLHRCPSPGNPPGPGHLKEVPRIRGMYPSMPMDTHRHTSHPPPAKHATHPPHAACRPRNAAAHATHPPHAACRPRNAAAHATHPPHATCRLRNAAAHATHPPRAACRPRTAAAHATHPPHATCRLRNAAAEATHPPRAACRPRTAAAHAIHRPPRLDQWGPHHMQSGCCWRLLDAIRRAPVGRDGASRGLNPKREGKQIVTAQDDRLVSQRLGAKSRVALESGRGGGGGALVGVPVPPTGWYPPDAAPSTAFLTAGNRCCDHPCEPPSAPHLKRIGAYVKQTGNRAAIPTGVGGDRPENATISARPSLCPPTPPPEMHWNGGRVPPV